MYKILFVCTGNTCRSPMAQGIFNKLVNDIELNFQEFLVSSCGILANNGSKTAENAISVLKEIGIDMSDHKSKRISDDLVAEFDTVVCMEDTNLKVFQELIPNYKGVVKVLNVADPYGFNIETYRACRDEIIEKCKALLKEIKSTQREVEN